jgi:hypothetical protein
MMITAKVIFLFIVSLLFLPGMNALAVGVICVLFQGAGKMGSAGGRGQRDKIMLIRDD